MGDENLAEFGAPATGQGGAHAFLEAEGWRAEGRPSGPTSIAALGKLVLRGRSCNAHRRPRRLSPPRSSRHSIGAGYRRLADAASRSHGPGASTSRDSRMPVAIWQGAPGPHGPRTRTALWLGEHVLRARRASSTERGTPLAAAGAGAHPGRSAGARRGLTGRGRSRRAAAAQEREPRPLLPACSVEDVEAGLRKPRAQRQVAHDSGLDLVEHLSARAVGHGQMRDDLVERAAVRWRLRPCRDQGGGEGSQPARQLGSR